MSRRSNLHVLADPVEMAAVRPFARRIGPDLYVRWHLRWTMPWHSAPETWLLRGHHPDIYQWRTALWGRFL